MTETQEKLRELVAHVFADGKLTAQERDELRQFWIDAHLTVAQVREVMTAFIRQSWGEALADGVLEDAERSKLRAIVNGLHLPKDCVPDEIQRAIE
jgi:hypothetical protein